jgi:hypothetical protein
MKFNSKFTQLKLACVLFIHSYLIICAEKCGIGHPELFIAGIGPKGYFEQRSFSKCWENAPWLLARWLFVTKTSQRKVHVAGHDLVGTAPGIGTVSIGVCFIQEHAVSCGHIVNCMWKLQYE